MIAALVAGVLAFASLARLEARLGDLKDSAEVSSNLGRMVDVVANARDSSEPVFVDPLLQRLSLDGGGNFSMALRYQLRLAGVPWADLRERRERLDDDRFEIDACATNRAVLQQLRIGEGDPLERLLPAGSVPAAGTVVWLVRVAEPRETVGGASLVTRVRPPIGASGRAVENCARGRLI